MRCSAIQERLVAWQDDELGPSEAQRVAEHVARCEGCRSVDHQLRRVMFDEPLSVPPEIEARLHAATQVGFLLAAAADVTREPRFPLESPWRRWLVDAVEVPAWSVLAAAAALLLITGYALHTAQTLEHTQAELAARATPDTRPFEITPIELPADQFQPASYQPGEEPGYR